VLRLNGCMERRLLIYGAREGGAGLRHGIGIAESLARRTPDTVMLLLASGNPEWMTLPDRVLFVPMTAQAHRLVPHNGVTMRARLLGDLIDEFRPDAVILDGNPLQLWQELPPVLGENGRPGTRPARLLVARDIDLPAVLRVRAMGSSLPDEALAWYDRILLVGDPYGAEASQAAVMSALPTAVRHVGWAAPRPRRNALAAARAACGVGGVGRFVLCAVSGRDSIGLARVFLAVADRRRDAWQAAMLVPAQLGARVVTALRHAAPPTVSVQIRRPALDDAIAGAEVVVTSLVDDAAPEALFHGRRLVAAHSGSVVTPAQALRAHALEQHERVRVLAPGAITVHGLGRAIDALLAAPVPGRRPVWARPDRFAAAIEEALRIRAAATNGHKH
jgi:predicted glycosyltransferase